MRARLFGTAIALVALLGAGALGGETRLQRWRRLREARREAIREALRQRSEAASATRTATHTRDGNTVSTEVVNTGPRGGTVTRQGTSTLEDGTIYHEGTITGPKDNTYTYDGTTTRDGNTVNHEHTVYDDDGDAVRSREGSTTFDKDAGTVSHEHTVTRKDGSEVTVESTRTKTEDGWEYEKNRTGPKGTASSEGTVVRDGDTWTKEGTVTGPNGRTGTVNGTAVKDGKSITYESSLTGDNGKTIRSREGEVTWGNGTREGHDVVTGPRGGTRTTDWVRSRNGNTVTREGLRNWQPPERPDRAERPKAGKKSAARPKLRRR